MIVTLEPMEYLHAAQGGFLRNARNITRQQYNAHGLAGDGYNEAVAGAVAEYVVALALGVPWRALTPLGAPDVTDRVEVRSTHHKHGRLILYPRDPSEKAFVLVVGCYPAYTVAGWLWAHEGKRADYWNPEARQPTYFVPQTALQPIETLKDLAYASR